MAQKKQDTLVLFPDIISATQRFTDEQFGALMCAAFSYRFSGEVYDGDDMAVDVAFRILSDQIDRYEEYRATMASNAKGSKVKRKPANGEQSDTPYPYPSPNVEEEADKPPKRTRFIPPTVDQVQQYCQEKGYAIDPQRFIDYYESNGWMVGKNKMKDWKAAVRSWNSREKKEKPINKRDEMPDFWKVPVI